MFVNVVNEKYIGLFNVIFLVYYYFVGEVEYFWESYGGVVDLILLFVELLFFNGGYWF